MRESRLLQFVLPFFVFVSACGLSIPPAQTPMPTAPAPVPSPQGKWSVSLVQTGGFAGLHLTVEVASDGQLVAVDNRSGRSATETLPPETLAELGRLVAETSQSGASPASPSACADCFIYDLAITSESGTSHFHVDDMTIGQSGAQTLIELLRNLRDRALKQQP